MTDNNFDISVIIPFFNERENLDRLTSELNNYLSGLNEIKAEVIFVDDGSTDGSLEILQKLPHRFYSARIIKLSRNYGSHAALRAGIMHSNGEFIIFIFADLQDPLELIEKLYQKAKEGYNIVSAYRNAMDVTTRERFFSKLYAKLMKKFVIESFPENGFDIVMFDRKVKDELNKNIESNSSIYLQILTMGFRQASITYNKNARLLGRSKWTFSKKVKMFIDSFVAFSYIPIRFVSIVGIILSLLGFLWMGYVVFRALVFHNISPGWPSLIAILMIGFGITNISLGIIAEYLWRTLDASRKRKVFIIDRIINCSQ